MGGDGLQGPKPLLTKPVGHTRVYVPWAHDRSKIRGRIPTFARGRPGILPWVALWSVLFNRDHEELSTEDRAMRESLARTNRGETVEYLDHLSSPTVDTFSVVGKGKGQE